MTREIVKLGLPKGRLLDPVVRFLREVGYEPLLHGEGVEHLGRTYHLDCSDDNFDLWVLKVRALPQMIALGAIDVGFCGLDLLEEAGYEQVVPVLDLGLNPVTLVVAVPEGKEDIVKNPPKRPLVIATEYENIADRWAAKHGLAHITIQTFGSTEAYAPAFADIVFDCVDTGRTLEANNLVVIDEIVKSATHLVVRDSVLTDPQQSPAVEHLQLRLRGLVDMYKQRGIDFRDFSNS